MTRSAISLSLLFCWLFLSGTSLSDPATSNAFNFDKKPASAPTLDAQNTFKASLPDDTGQDRAFAMKGFIATLDDPVIRNEQGAIVNDPTRFDWMEEEAPPTVNPSLWRQTNLLRVHGLFKVAEGVWQVRGLDGANLTLVQGNTGWIVIDPTMTTETARRAMDLVEQHLGKQQVKAVLYTHTHPDHYGGIRGVSSPDSNPVVIAPEHFVAELTSEYLMAGNVASRRSSYQFGMVLETGPQGFMGGGITASASTGTVRFVVPDDYIKSTGESRVVDGVTLAFQMVPETEAPAEMNVFLPAQKTLYVSEITSCTLHNIQTPRGALVRDALQWAGYITEALSLYGGSAQALMGGHCWPRFGQQAIQQHLTLQRDNYKFIHDQTVRLMNNGLTPLEIAEQIKLPEAIANEWSNRGYYGTLKHNAKGVYQRYIGWWDGNPANLDQLPPQQRGQRYLAAMGGAEKIVQTAISAMGEGDYRWSAEILNHVVFAEPDNLQARALLADSYEQLGYQAEAATWRNYYLTGAAELRGIKPATPWLDTPELPELITTPSLLDVMATRINPEKIGNEDISVELVISDRDETASFKVSNAVMVHTMGSGNSTVDVSLVGPRKLIAGLLMQKLPISQMEKAGLQVRGNRTKLLAFQNAMDIPPMDYPIVTP